MPVMDEFREERQALKNKSLKEKLSYFFDYYKWHTVAAIALTAMAISLIVNFVTHKDWGFYVCMLNSSELPYAEEYVQNFADYAGIDTKKYDTVFDTSMYISLDMAGEETVSSLQKLMAYAAAGDIDVMIADTEIIERYANSDSFHDLRDILTTEQQALWEPYFYYVDQTVVDAISEANRNGQNYDSGYPDPRKPEAMVNPVPVGIYLEGCASLREHFYFRSDKIVLGVYVNSSRVETALKFIDYIMQD